MDCRSTLTMALLLTEEAIDRRRIVATGPLASLTSSLLADTAIVAHRGAQLPTWKARFSRGYARCATCGGPLAFDPWSPHAHRGIRCAHRTVGHEADGWWAVGAQLWAADRAVHAATLALLADDAMAHDVACTLLEAIAVHATLHSERESVLGPSAPFFSTYLESLWALSVAVAVDLLNADARRRPRIAPAAQRARQAIDIATDQILVPSLARIARFDEGASNRQCWNNAAMLAVATLVDDRSCVARLTDPTHGALAQAMHGLLEDGSWSEGENYHQFAVRGIWYLVQMHRSHGWPMPEQFAHRYARAWSAPMATAWPDRTLAARRDAQYGVTLQQWRWAEWAELGRIEGGDSAIDATLQQIYAAPVERCGTGRLEATGEAEVNRPPTGLTRADLGWKSLLCAAPEPPSAATAQKSRSVILPSQGLAVLRSSTAQGERMAALDFGHAGGGHGHPDRLALTLADGQTRLLDDWGTGTYADPSLAWYRSALAHTAPIIDGGGEEPRAGQLVGLVVDALAAAVRASYIEPRRGVRLWRSLCLTETQLIDIVEWESPDGAAVRLDLPLSIEAEWAHAHDEPVAFHAASLADEWRRASQGATIDDGARFAEQEMRSAAPIDGCVHARITAATSHDVALVVAATAPFDLWQLDTPGAPAWSARHEAPRRKRTLVSATAAKGCIASVWSFVGATRGWEFTNDGLVSANGDEAHRVTNDGWTIRSGTAPTWTAKWEPVAPVAPPDPERRAQVNDAHAIVIPQRVDRTDGASWRTTLAEDAFLHAEVSWEQYGRPTVTVELWEDPDFFRATIELAKQPLVLVDPLADNRLDTWPPELHGDAVMLAVRDEHGRVHESILSVHGQGRTPHIRSRSTDSSTVDATVTLTAAGMRLDLGWSPAASVAALAVAVVLRRPGSERRDGALVWPPRRGWIYGLGDRIGGSIPLVPIHHLHV
jgi:hypothetical protein